MFSFKSFLLTEIAEPTKPFNKIKKNYIKKDQSTWKERKVIQYKFITNNGNEVKIHFEKIKPNTYDVMFYVNDSQFDDASKSEENIRDKEILGNVLWIIKQKCNKLKINELTFTAQTGQKDIKNVKNLDVNKYKIPFLLLLNKIKSQINAHQPKIIEPNYTLYAKLNRQPPPPKPDLDKDLFNKIFEKIKQLVDNNQPLENVFNNTYHQFEQLKNVNIDPNEFLKSFSNLSNAIQSNQPQGWNRSINRREILWEKLFNKFFPDWKLIKYGTKFQLIRY